MTLLVKDNFQRIDKYLTLSLNLTRNHVQKLIDQNKVTVNGKIVSSSYKVSLNDEINIDTEETIQVSEIIPEEIPLSILYEDDDLIVVDKPKGIVVHPSLGHSQGTIVNSLKFYFSQLANNSDSIRPGIVHRLDKDTSGLLIVCKNDKALHSIQEQIQNKTARRNYFALVHGIVQYDTFKVDAPIGRHPTNRQKMAVVREGKNAVTNFKIVEKFTDCTLLECMLETGRTHQIRVHLNYAKYYIVGDLIYGKLKETLKTGQYLHAHQLVFRQPTTNQEIIVNSPLPFYYESMIQLLHDHGSMKEALKWMK
jgi:23S rRNA pseudouridine1911/1915/1917 synthase